MTDAPELLLKEQLDTVYTPIEVAKEEIWKRWNDQDLRKRVETALRDDIPATFSDAPRIVLARQVVSPNFELLNFLDLAKKINLSPFFFEYSSDKFTTKNDDKYYLAKLYFHAGVGKRGGEIVTSKKITDIDKYDGKPFSEMKTLWGDSFIHFHHMLASPLVSETDIYDISESYKKNGETADKYYFYYLSLFLCHAVLAENYLLNDNYAVFTQEVFYPNFKKVHDFFGLKPLIVRMVPSEKENDLYWRYYPQSTRDNDTMKERLQ